MLNVPRCKSNRIIELTHIVESYVVKQRKYGKYVCEMQWIKEKQKHGNHFKIINEFKVRLYSRWGSIHGTHDLHSHKYDISYLRIPSLSEDGFTFNRLWLSQILLNVSLKLIHYEKFASISQGIRHYVKMDWVDQFDLSIPSIYWSNRWMVDGQKFHQWPPWLSIVDGKKRQSKVKTLKPSLLLVLTISKFLCSSMRLARNVY